MKKNTKNKRKSKSVDSISQQDSVVSYKNRLKPRSANQSELIRTIVENTITFCQGVAGSGKTHIAVGLALEYLLDNKVSRIVVTRPVVESGERIGFLPGTAEEKLHPYLLPILDEIAHFIPMSQYISLKTQHRIEIVPLGLMRGRNFHNCFIVADECQNASYDQLKMLLTRIGNDSKMVLTGDVSQSDLQKHMRGGFLDLINALGDIDGIGFRTISELCSCATPIIGKILSRLDSYEDGNQK